MEDFEKILKTVDSKTIEENLSKQKERDDALIKQAEDNFNNIEKILEGYIVSITQ